MQKLLRRWFGTKGWTDRKSVIYYLSGLGDDTNNGTHPLQAWKSIEKLNREKHRILANDQILFQRGHHYSGVPFYLKLPRSEQMKVGAYGSGNYPVWPDLKTEEQPSKQKT